MICRLTTGLIDFKVFQILFVIKMLHKFQYYHSLYKNTSLSSIMNSHKKGNLLITT